MFPTPSKIRASVDIELALRFLVFKIDLLAIVVRDCCVDHRCCLFVMMLSIAVTGLLVLWGAYRQAHTLSIVLFCTQLFMFNDETMYDTKCTIIFRPNLKKNSILTFFGK